MGIYLVSTDLPVGVGAGLGLTADQMIGDAEAMAALAAPCLGVGVLGVSLGTVSVAITTGVLTVSVAETLVVGDRVVLGTMIGAAPLVAGTVYYVQSVPSSTTLTLAATSSGAAIVTTSAGSSSSIQQSTPLTATQTSALVAVMRGAIMRWNDAGSGARSSVTTGPFGETVDTTVARRGMYWPSEITSLQNICSGGVKSGAFAVDTVATTTIHADTCSLNFGATYCSCGADIAGYPLYG
jgi:hypothetical protein